MQKTNKTQYPLISAILLSYNRREELCTSLKYLALNPYPSLEIIVVDNASTDGSVEMVRNLFPKVKYLSLKENLGIAAWNEGMECANGDYFLCLDDDSYPLTDALLNATNYLDDTVILGCKIVTPNGDWDTSFFDERYQKRSFIGCGVIIPRKVFTTIGGYNPLLFIYHHEIEYAIRAVDKGFTIHYAEDVKICHMRSSKNRQVIGHLDRRFLYYSTRNSIIILLLNFSFFRVIDRLLRMIAGRLLFSIVHGTISTVIRAMYDGFITAIKNWEKRTVVSIETQKFYENGKLIASFFGDGTYALKRPKWLSL